MNIQEDVSLRPFNTFGLDVKAKFFAEVSTQAGFNNIKESKFFKENRKLILGGGSNILFTRDFDGLVLLNHFRGISTVAETAGDITMEIGSGENWHQFVMSAVDQGLGGIENLSLIPGTVGAAPMQNIGAYGVEIKEVFQELKAINLETSQVESFSKEDCEFGYRSSVFKTRAKGKYLITSVTLKLNRLPVLNTSYKGIRAKLEEMDPANIDVKAVSQAVISIRREKLPDPAQIGNAGSFFKNPVIDSLDFEGLRAEFPEVPSYPVSTDQVKIPAAWLIEQCGWKGKKLGNIGVHQNQPLVLVNYGSGNGAEINKLATAIQQSVADTFGVKLEAEVNIA